TCKLRKDSFNAAWEALDMGKIALKSGQGYMKHSQSRCCALDSVFSFETTDWSRPTYCCSCCVPPVVNVYDSFTIDNASMPSRDPCCDNTVKETSLLECCSEYSSKWKIFYDLAVQLCIYAPAQKIDKHQQQ
ncbi:hypothetical protein DOY81_012211, partial [Sarcophaga bullata]